MVSGNNQDVCWRLRVDITEGDYPFVLLDRFARYLAGNNLAEDAVHFLSPPSVFRFALFKEVAAINIVGDNRREVFHGQPQDGFGT